MTPIEPQSAPEGLTKSQVIAAYRAVAPLYDLWGLLTEAAARRRCLDVAAIKNGESVLEVAVGTGLLFESIVKSNASGHNEGIDLTSAMLDRARKRLMRLPRESYRLQVGDAYSLPFHDGSFDLAVSTYMFDLLPERDFAAVVAELRRVLRPGGRIVLVNLTRGSGILDRVWNGIYRAAPALVGGCRPVEVTPVVETGGFVRVRREVIEQLGFPSEVVLAYKPEAPSEVAS